MEPESQYTPDSLKQSQYTPDSLKMAIDAFNKLENSHKELLEAAKELNDVLSGDFYFTALVKLRVAIYKAEGK